MLIPLEPFFFFSHLLNNQFSVVEALRHQGVGYVHSFIWLKKIDNVIITTLFPRGNLKAKNDEDN